MKFLFFFVCIWLADHFTNATRDPENCGVGSPFLLIANNRNEPENVWSTGYKGVMYVAHFDRNTTKIVWNIVHYRGTTQRIFQKQKISSTNATEWTTQEKISDKFKFKVWENLGIERPYTEVYIRTPDDHLLQMNVSFAAYSSPLKLCSIMNISFTECRTEPPLMVVSRSSDYKSAGKFTCEEGFDLVPANPSASVKTWCLANASWNNTTNFKCYKAPNDTRIVGNLMIKEHEKMEINCNFTQTIPSAGKSKFSFDGEIQNLLVGVVYNKTITLEDDGKEIWCQPLSNYTDIEQFSDKGKSPSRQLSVLFSPRYEPNQPNNATNGYNWKIGIQNSCNFTFMSRPLADTVNLYTVVYDSQNTSKHIPVGMQYKNISVGDLQTITITDIKSDQLKSQQFQLQILSSGFPDKIFNVTFDLNVSKVQAPTEPFPSNQTSVYVGVGIVVIILILLFLAVLCKRQQLFGNRKPSEGLGREERVNVIYNADAEEEREEKINPIYETEESCVSIRGSSNVMRNSHVTETTLDARCNEYELEDVVLEDLYDKATDDAYDNDEQQNGQGRVTNQPQGLYAEVDKTKNLQLEYDDSETYAEVT